jgi:hypothetical protein
MIYYFLLSITAQKSKEVVFIEINSYFSPGIMRLNALTK